MCENLENYCRICLDVESEHISILADTAVPLHIKTCLAMTVSATDDLPKDICVSCASQLSDFYNFKLNAMFSLDWLESCIQEKSKKSETKYQPIQPLPDCEYNSDSLLEFLNNTENIEEYLNNLGRDDIPSIVNMLDRNNENSIEAINKATRNLKIPSPKKKEITSKATNFKINMEVDALDSEVEIVNEILMKETEPKQQTSKVDKIQSNTGKTLPSTGKLLPRYGKTQPTLETPQINSTKSNIEKIQLDPEKTESKTDKLEINYVKSLLSSDKSPENVNLQLLKQTNTCFACKFICKDLQNLLEHLNTCDYAVRTCILCLKMFDSKHQMLKHSITHSTISIDSPSYKCICTKEFSTKESLLHHHNLCEIDYTSILDYVYRCKKCKQTFNERSSIYKHVKEHILKEKRVCTLCKHCYFGDKALEKHKKEVHEEQEPNGSLYRCKVCHHTSESYQELYKHVQTHLNPELNSHLCDICGTSFETHKMLLCHSLTHQKVNVKERDMKCNGNNSMMDQNIFNSKPDEVKVQNREKRPYSETDMLCPSLTHQKVNVKKRDIKCKENNYSMKDQNIFNAKSDEVKAQNGEKRPYSETDCNSNEGKNLCKESEKTSNQIEKKNGLHNQISGHVLEVTICEKCGDCVTSGKINKHFCA